MLSIIKNNKDKMVIGLILILIAIYIIGNITYKKVETISIEDAQVIEVRSYNSTIELNGQTKKVNSGDGSYFCIGRKGSNLAVILEQNIFKTNRYTLVDLDYLQ